MAELRPCPFCGCECIAAEIYLPGKEFRIYCMSDECCPAEMRLSFSDAGLGAGDVIDFAEAEKVMTELVEAWNRRAGDPNGS